jgi:glycosyltransferase involved in cell wall biosynthesis
MISVVIPTYRRNSIFKCLESLAYQMLAPEFEVIVVVRDGTIAFIRDLYFYKFVKVIEYNDPGNGPAKNIGVNFAKGDFIAFTDDDCIVDPLWLNRLNYIQSISNADIVVGQCLPADVRNPYLIAHQGMIMYFLDKNPVYDCHSDTVDKVTVGTTMNMLIRKDTFESLKGFDPIFKNHYGDDFDFNMRWKLNKNITVAYCKSAVVRHAHPLTFKTLLKLNFRYGIGLEVCRQLAVSYITKAFVKAENTNDFKLLSCICEVTLHPFIYEYLYIKKYISYKSSLLNESYTVTRDYASWLAMLALVAKRLGSWYGKRHPKAISKIYD